MNNPDALNLFHPTVKEWFLNHIGVPSLPQVEGWPQIYSGQNVLISAPTGSGKTLAAFLESINRLLVMGLEQNLPEGVFILYVSPLKALNNDIYKNLEVPLQGIRKIFEERGEVFPDIVKAVRTGDTTTHERQRMLKKPPQILITTPESLFLLLTSGKSRDMLKNVHYVIVDEIHTLLGTKRGVHLALSLERLEHLAERNITRIGLSATVNPLDMAARYLGGRRNITGGYEERLVQIIAPAMERSKELTIHVPVKDYRVLEQGSVWPDIYETLVKRINEHHSTIIFVNNRTTAERVAANINSIADREICCPHHGSISKQKRLQVEDRFKNGELQCIVATSTLELGIDVGSVDFIIQVAAPPSVSSGLQRLGRAGHRLSAVSKGEIIPKTRGDLLRACFLAGEMLDGRIEKERIPFNCLDIFAQHVVSMSCTEKWTEDDMLALIRQAYSYHTLQENEFKKVLAMLAGDYEHMEDIPAKPRVLWDRQNKTIEGTSYSRMLAVSSSGTIPDRGAFTVYLEDYKTRIGELDEEFVFESRLGDRFFLGNSPWKISRIDKNRVIVAPCSSVGAKTPFWKGDGIGTPFEQAQDFGRYIQTLAQQAEEEVFIETDGAPSLLNETVTLNLRNYLVDQMDALGTISTHRRVVIEYTSSSETDNKLIIHAHFGGRVNSVLAILFQHALDKLVRCKAYTSFTNDAILIHFYGFSDDINDIFSLISHRDVERVLMNMLPKTSRFALTFRYNAYRALIMGVRRHGQRLPLWIQRLRSVDALENAQKYMDHPLIIETMRECLEDVYDIPNTILVLKDIEEGRIQVVEKRTWFPSPFSSEILFDFQAILLYMEKDPHPEMNEYPAISGVDALHLSYRQKTSAALLREDATEEVLKNNNTKFKLGLAKSANELHSFFLIYGDIKQEDMIEDPLLKWADELLLDKRIVPLPGSCPRFIAVEEINLYSAAENISFNDAEIPYRVEETETYTQDEAITRILRRYARYNSPFTVEQLKERYPYSNEKIEKILAGLMADGYILITDDQKTYYHSTIYDRIIRLSMNKAVDEIKPRDAQALTGLLALMQNISLNPVSKEDALLDTISQLEGLYLPADAWENIVFARRIKEYAPHLLDKLCTSGRVMWRILPDASKKEWQLAWFKVESLSYESEDMPDGIDLSEKESKVYQILKQKGASFTHGLSSLSGTPTSELLDVLKEMAGKGLIVNDLFQPVRIFMDEDAWESKDPVKKAKKIALMVSKLNLGRWELAYPPKKPDRASYIKRWSLRYGMISKEIASLEQSPYSWPEIYEVLKHMEMAGDIHRGYYFKEISGIQFMVSSAVKKLDLAGEDYLVLNACDPAQPYGRIIPHSSHDLTFSCIPGTVIVLYQGKPVLILERYGEKITVDSHFVEIKPALKAFHDAFQNKRIWPDRKKIVVKFWPEDTKQKENLKEALQQSGFVPEIDRMVLWRSSV